MPEQQLEREEEASLLALFKKSFDKSFQNCEIEACK
jgi:hypothetical protein